MTKLPCSMHLFTPGATVRQRLAKDGGHECWRWCSCPATNPATAAFRGLPFLKVKCRDLPHLMLEGFFRSTDNILPKESSMLHYSTPRPWSDIGFHHARVWRLVDKSNGETPLWVAQLEVLSRSVAVLSGFQVDELPRENVHRAHAWNAEQQLVYRFEYLWPEYCYNCIYNDMPLQGWWPWPRPREGCARGDVNIPGPAVEPERPEDAGNGPPPAPTQSHQKPSGCFML